MERSSGDLRVTGSFIGPRRNLIPARGVGDPGGLTLQLPIDGGIEARNLAGVGRALYPLESLDPDAVPFGIDLAAAVGTHTAAGPIPQLLGTGHRAGHTGVVEHTLPAGAAVKGGALKRAFEGMQEARDALHPQPFEEPAQPPQGPGREPPGPHPRGRVIL
jgi:hypothetical protein